ncbi:MAG TPA: hypothetical protein VMU62_01650, partial [Acidobacteriaceae bacterium]|nr:hypothetical protein [Acidobacteriaceae bacterium]
ANLNLDLKTHGITTADLAQQTIASYTSQWKSGGWDAPALMKTPLARFDQLILRGQVQNQVVRIVSGSLSVGQRSQPVAGTISFQGQANLYLQSSQLQIKGTLAHPVVRSSSQKEVKEMVK